MRIERDGWTHTRLTDSTQRAVQVRAHLVVYVHNVDAELGKLVDELPRLDDHQMHVERLLTDGAYRLNDRKAKGKVWDKYTIHHVNVEPVALTLVDHRDLVGEMQEVSTEEGGRYNSHSEGVF